MEQIALLIGELLGRLDCENDITDEKRASFKILQLTNRESLESDIQNAKTTKENEVMKYHGLTIKHMPGCKNWSTRYRMNGKQYYISAKTQNELIKILKERLNIREKIKQKLYTFEDWFNDWLNLYKIGYVKNETIKQFKSTFNHLSKEFVEFDLTKISSDMIAREIKPIEQARTKQKVYEMLKQTFDQAVISSKLDKNPILAVPKPKYIRDRGVSLNSTQYKEFVKACINQGNDTLLLILYEGLRIGEALGICGEDVDFENNTLNINKSFSQDGEFDTTKNKQSIRLVPIFINALPLLQKIKLKPKERIFNISQKQLRRSFDKIKAECGLPASFRIHDLRHTFITDCQNKNIPEHIIQAWVGHEIGSSVTKSTYTHVNQDANLLYTNKLNSLLRQ